MRLAGGNHQQNTIRPITFLACLYGAFNGLFPDRYSSKQNSVQFSGQPLALAYTTEQLICIFELRHPFRVSEIGKLNVFKAGKHQFLCKPNLCFCRNEFLFVLKTVPDGDVTNGNLLRIIHRDGIGL